MIVYRLEDKNERGPFGFMAEWPKDYTGDASIHNREGCTVVGIPEIGYRKWRFGCRNITQLKKYWGGEIEKFEREGWVIAKYKVRKNFIKFGTKDIELAFNIDKAIRL